MSSISTGFGRYLPRKVCFCLVPKVSLSMTLFELLGYQHGCFGKAGTHVVHIPAHCMHSHGHGLIQVRGCRGFPPLSFCVVPSSEFLAGTGFLGSLGLFSVRSASPPKGARQHTEKDQTPSGITFGSLVFPARRSASPHKGARQTCMEKQAPSGIILCVPADGHWPAMTPACSECPCH